MIDIKNEPHKLKFVFFFFCLFLNVNRSFICLKLSNNGMRTMTAIPDAKPVLYRDIPPWRMAVLETMAPLNKPAIIP